MVIRFNKFYAFIFSLIIISVSFTFAVMAQKESSEIDFEKEVRVPVVMYHHVTKKCSKANRYTVLYEELENDLKYIKEKGYETVTVSDLIDYVDEKKQLNKKVIMLTFDDGFESFYTYVFPLLKKYNMKAIVTVIGYVTEKYSKIDDHNVNYANLNRDELKKLCQSGLVEVQSHSYDMHGIGTISRRGVAKMRNESEKEYEKALSDDLKKMQKLIQESTGKPATAIAYPYGAYTSTTNDIIKKLGFKASFTCEEKVSVVRKKDVDSLYFLGRFNRPTGESTKDFFSKLIID